jgi:hypothetical protein
MRDTQKNESQGQMDIGKRIYDRIVVRLNKKRYDIRLVNETSRTIDETKQDLLFLSWVVMVYNVFGSPLITGKLSIVIRLQLFSIT